MGKEYWPLALLIAYVSMFGPMAVVAMCLRPWVKARQRRGFELESLHYAGIGVVLIFSLWMGVELSGWLLSRLGLISN
jgi:hypothetical protein